MKRILLSCLLISSAVAAPPTTTLMKSYATNLGGSFLTTRWTYINFLNPDYYPDVPNTMKGTLSASLPGYGASDGVYSYTGPYTMTAAYATNDFDIHHAVVQFDLVWDPSTSFPSGGGPKLNYNGGNQQLSPKPMIIGASRQTVNNTGIPEMEHLDSFVYRGVTFQWDLSAIEEDIHSVRIVTPMANHTSVVGAQIDIASEYEELTGTSLTPMQIWRDTFFSTTANSGNAADHADPDNDGLSNLIEYALGTRPENTDDEQGRAATPALSFVDGRARLSFKIPSSPPADLTYYVDVSADLTTWKTLATKQGAGAWSWLGEGPSRITTETSIERQPIHVGDETTAAGKRFLRLRASH